MNTTQVFEKRKIAVAIGIDLAKDHCDVVAYNADGSVRISVSGEVIPGAAQRGCPLYLRCSMPDLMR